MFNTSNTSPNPQPSAPSGWRWILAHKIVLSVVTGLLVTGGVSAMILLSGQPKVADTPSVDTPSTTESTSEPTTGPTQNGPTNPAPTASGGDGGTYAPIYTALPNNANRTSPARSVATPPGNQDSGTSGGDTDEDDTDGGTPADPCALPNYPTASCTGVPAGTTLTTINSDVTITVDGTVIDGQHINGCVIVQAANVTIRNSKITCHSFYAVASYASSDEGGLVIEDTEIDCEDHNTTGISFVGVIGTRLNIHGCENGWDVSGDALIQDNYIHDLFEGSGGHGDGIQLTDIAHDVTISHNTIYAASGTSAIISPNVSAGVVSNILIQDNLLAGGAFTLYCQQNGPGINYRVIDNRFSRLHYPTVGAFGPWTDCEDEAAVTGNVYHDTSLPLPL